MPTPTETCFLDVIIERRPLDNPWKDHTWTIVAVQMGEKVQGSSVWTEVPDETLSEGVTRYRISGLAVELFRKETEGYKVNLSQPAAQVYVVLRANEDEEAGQDIEVFHVTVCPYEAEGYAESGDETVEGVPMPDELKALVQTFIDSHHVEVPFKKRKRKDHDPRKGEAVRAAPRAGPRAAPGR